MSVNSVGSASAATRSSILRITAIHRKHKTFLRLIASTIFLSPLLSTDVHTLVAFFYELHHRNIHTPLRLFLLFLRVTFEVARSNRITALLLPRSTNLCRTSLPFSSLVFLPHLDVCEWAGSKRRKEEIGRNGSRRTEESRLTGERNETE